ncbi:hypothetical protein PLACP1_00340 [Planifilum fimeticola]
MHDPFLAKDWMVGDGPSVCLRLCFPFPGEFTVRRGGFNGGAEGDPGTTGRRRGVEAKAG